MNRAILIFTAVLFCFTYSIYAQQKPTESIVMTTKPLSEQREILDLFRFQNIDYYQTTIKGNIKGKYYSITAKEIWNGKVTKTDTIFDSSKGELAFIGKHKTDSLKFSLMTSKAGKKKLKVNFSLDRVGLYKEYKCTASESYSLRDVGTEMTIEPGKPFYAFAYILPYKLDNGGSSWCAVESSGKDIEKWGQEFGIKHYILFEMNFFE